MQIGRLAKRAGVTVRTIRYYEQMGLLAPSSHSSGGFRLYGEDSIHRLEIIAFFKNLDMSLTEIRGILKALKGERGNRESIAELQKVFSGKLKLVESQLEFLRKMKTELSQVLAILQTCRACHHDILLDSEDCPECRRLPGRKSLPDLFHMLLQNTLQV